MPTHSAAAAAAWRQQHVGPSRRSALSPRKPAEPTAPGASFDPRIAAARLARDTALAEIARLQADELKGLLIRKDAAARVLSTAAKVTRLVVERMPGPSAHRFSGAETPQRVFAVLKELAGEMLAEIHRANEDARKQLPPDAPTTEALPK